MNEIPDKDHGLKKTLEHQRIERNRREFDNLTKNWPKQGPMLTVRSSGSGVVIECWDDHIVVTDDHDFRESYTPDGLATKLGLLKEGGR